MGLIFVGGGGGGIFAKKAISRKTRKLPLRENFQVYSTTNINWMKIMTWYLFVSSELFVWLVSVLRISVFSSLLLSAFSFSLSKYKSAINFLPHELNFLTNYHFNNVLYKFIMIIKTYKLFKSASQILLENTYPVCCSPFSFVEFSVFSSLFSKLQIEITTVFILFFRNETSIYDFGGITCKTQCINVMFSFNIIN